MAEVKEVRCINCNKKLAEVTPSYITLNVSSTAIIQEGIKIKCPRCSVISAVNYNLLTTLSQSAIV